MYLLILKPPLLLWIQKVLTHMHNLLDVLLMGSLMGVHITEGIHGQLILLGLDVCLMKVGTHNTQYWLVHYPRFRPEE